MNVINSAYSLLVFGVLAYMVSSFSFIDNIGLTKFLSAIIYLAEVPTFVQLFKKRLDHRIAYQVVDIVNNKF